MSINQVTISGNITRDPKVIDTVSGSCVLKFGVAVNDRRKNKDGQWEDYASFFDCVMFGKRAQSLSQYIHKGTKVCVSGKLNQDRWEDKKTGENRTNVVIHVDEFEFMNRREKPTQAIYEDDEIPF